MVSKNAGNVLGAEVAKRRSNVLESLVVGGENGDVGSVVDGVKQIGRIDGSTEGRESSSGKCVGSVLGNSQHSVNDVNHTTSKVYILRLLAVEMGR